MPNDVPDWQQGLSDAAFLSFGGNLQLATNSAAAFALGPGPWVIGQGGTRLHGIRLDYAVVGPTAPRGGAGTVPLLKFDGSVSFATLSMYPPLLPTTAQVIAGYSDFGLAAPFDLVANGFAVGDTVTVTAVSQFGPGGPVTWLTLNLWTS